MTRQIRIANKWYKRLHVNTRNGGDGHFTVDVNIIAKITSDLSAELLVQNIADEVYYYPFGGLARAPGPRRSALLTAALSVW